MFPATALAAITMGEIVLPSSSEAALTSSLNLGSSEFSTSRLATRRTRLARRAMLVAPATNIWGWTLAIDTLHFSMSFLMASSDASKRDFVSMASSTRPEIEILNIWKNFKRFDVAFYVIWVFAYWSFFQCCQSIGSSWSQSVHMQPGCQGSSAKYVQQKWPAHEYSKR